MAKPLIDDELWALIEPLIPVKKRRFRHPGRKPLPPRQVLTGIVFVLTTGIPWEYLPQEMGCGSGMTCWRRLEAWHKAGVWQKVLEVLLAKLRQAECLDLSRVPVDASSVRAVGAGEKNRPQPHRSRQARHQAPPRHRRPGRALGRHGDGGQRKRHHAVAPAAGEHPAHPGQKGKAQAQARSRLGRPGLQFRTPPGKTAPAGD